MLALTMRDVCMPTSFAAVPALVVTSLWKRSNQENIQNRNARFNRRPRAVRFGGRGRSGVNAMCTFTET